MRGVYLAQVVDVYPADYQIAVYLPHLARREGIRVDLAGVRQHPTAGDFEMPEVGDFGVVAMLYNDARGGVWLTSVRDRNRHLAPSELLTADPFARVSHRPSDRYTIQHGDGSEEHVFPDNNYDSDGKPVGGTRLKITTAKDGTPGNTGLIGRFTARLRTLSAALGRTGERQPYRGRRQPPADVMLDHASGAKIHLTADGSFTLETPHGHRLRLFDATEHGRSPTTGAVTSTPDPTRAGSEVTLETEKGLRLTLHDGDGSRPTATLETPAGNRATLTDGPTPQVRLETPAGHRVTLKDGADAHLALETPGGRRILMSDFYSETIITDPARVLVVAPEVMVDADAVQIAGGGPPAARVGDNVEVTLNVVNGAFGGVASVTVTSAVISSGSAKTTIG